MSTLLEFAKRELDLIGMTEDDPDEYNSAMRRHILTMVQTFSQEGHSGFSAAYAVECLSKLLRYQALTPLTGEDDEWTRIDFGPDMAYQNNRCYRVFKREDGTAYDSEGMVFVDTDGTRYTNASSRVDIEFPYTPNTYIVSEKP